MIPNKCITLFLNPLGFDSVYIPWNAAIARMLAGTDARPWLGTAKPTKGFVQARIVVDPHTDSWRPRELHYEKYVGAGTTLA